MEHLDRNPDVVATELEVGAVLLNIGTGFYYSLNEPGAEIWRAIDGATGTDALAERLRQRFDVDAERSAASAAAFVAELAREGLVVEGDGRRDGDIASAASAGERLPFREPELVKHDEPLHEVSMSPFDPQLPLAE